MGNTSEGTFRINIPEYLIFISIFFISLSVIYYYEYSKLMTINLFKFLSFSDYIDITITIALRLFFIIFILFYVYQLYGRSLILFIKTLFRIFKILFFRHSLLKLIYSCFNKKIKIKNYKIRIFFIITSFFMIIGLLVYSLYFIIVYLFNQYFYDYFKFLSLLYDNDLYEFFKNHYMFCINLILIFPFSIKFFRLIKDNLLNSQGLKLTFKMLINNTTFFFVSTWIIFYFSYAKLQYTMDFKTEQNKFISYNFNKNIKQNVKVIYNFEKYSFFLVDSNEIQIVNNSNKIILKKRIEIK